MEGGAVALLRISGCPRELARPILDPGKAPEHVLTQVVGTPLDGTPVLLEKHTASAVELADHHQQQREGVPGAVQAGELAVVSG
jgi:hypothetical protein